REEYEFIRKEAKLVSELGMQTFRRVPVSAFGDRLDGVSLQGVTPNMGVISNTQIEQGRYFTENDNLRHLSVAFIGADIKGRFFEGVDPVGKILSVDGRQYTVIGVARAQGSV